MNWIQKMNRMRRKRKRNRKKIYNKTSKKLQEIIIIKNIKNKNKIIKNKFN